MPVSGDWCWTVVGVKKMPLPLLGGASHGVYLFVLTNSTDLIA